MYDLLIGTPRAINNSKYNSQCMQNNGPTGPMGPTGPAGNGSTGLVTVNVGNSVYVDAIYGKPSGEIENFTDPYININDAADAAGNNSSADKIITVYVRPGLYTATDNLARNNVNWYFEEGATIISTGDVLFDASNLITGFDVVGYGEFESSVSNTLFNIGNSVDVNNTFTIEGKSAIITSLPSANTQVININENSGHCNINFETISIFTNDVISSTEDYNYACLNIHSTNVVVNANNISIYLPGTTVTLGRFITINMSLSSSFPNNNILINSNIISLRIKEIRSESTNSYFMTVSIMSTIFYANLITVMMNSNVVELVTNDITEDINNLHDLYTILCDSVVTKFNINEVYLTFSDDISQPITMKDVSSSPSLKSNCTVIGVIILNECTSDMNINLIYLDGSNLIFSGGIMFVYYGYNRNILKCNYLISLVATAYNILHLFTYSSSCTINNLIFTSNLVDSNINGGSINTVDTDLVINNLDVSISRYNYGLFFNVNTSNICVKEGSINIDTYFYWNHLMIFTSSNVNMPNIQVITLYITGNNSDSFSIFKLTDSVLNIDNAIYANNDVVSYIIYLNVSGNSKININVLDLSHSISNGLYLRNCVASVALNHVFISRLGYFLDVMTDACLYINRIEGNYVIDGGAVFNINNVSIEYTVQININNYLVGILRNSYVNVTSHFLISVLAEININKMGPSLNNFPELFTIRGGSVVHLNVRLIYMTSSIGKIISISPSTTVYANINSISLTTGQGSAPPTLDSKYLIFVNNANLYFNNTVLSIDNRYPNCESIFAIRYTQGKTININIERMACNEGLIFIDNSITSSSMYIHVGKGEFNKKNVFEIINENQGLNDIVISGKYVNTTDSIISLTSDAGDTYIKLSNCIFITSNSNPSIKSSTFGLNNIAMYSPCCANNSANNINFSPNGPNNNWYYVNSLFS